MRAWKPLQFQFSVPLSVSDRGRFTNSVSVLPFCFTSLSPNTTLRAPASDIWVDLRWTYDMNYTLNPAQ